MNHLLTFKIAGTNHHQGAPLVGTLDQQTLNLEYEPDNQYDERAIKILSPDGIMLGYVPKVINELFHSLGSLDKPYDVVCSDSFTWLCSLRAEL